MEVCIDVPELPLPTPGMYLSIQVTVVLNSFRFYCVLPHGMKNVENRFKEDDEETLETLQVNHLCFMCRARVCNYFSIF
jgi:hypothetical protein